MMPDPSPSQRALPVAAVGGLLYATGIFLWAVTTGIRFPDGLSVLIVGIGFAGTGMFLIAAVPLYVLGRLSLVSPLLVAVWSLGNLIYLRWYVPRPHDALASYLVIWPLFIGMIGAAGVIEFVIRVGTERGLGLFGIRSLY